MTSQPSTLHFCKSTSVWPAPRRPVRDNERTFQVATLSSPVRDHAQAAFCLILTLRRLSGRASPTFPINSQSLLRVTDFLFGPTIQVHALLVGLTTEWVQQSHSASAASLISPLAYRICCLLTLVHLQSARFPRRCPETGKNSTASGLSLKLITANAVCSLGHRRRPNTLCYCCVHGCLCR